MKPKLKRWLRVAAIALVLAFAALNILAYRHARAMMRFTNTTARTETPEKLGLGQKIGVLLRGVDLPRPTTTLAPAALSPGARSLIIDCTNGIRLGAWYCAGPANSPLVILCHGYGGEKTGTLPEAKAFLELGMSVLMVDFRGSGDSSESYTTVGYAEADDVAAAVNYARTNLAAQRIVLYGQSMGAVAILRAVSANHVQPDVIILDAVFDRMLTTVKHRFEAMKIPSFPAAQLLVFWGGWQAGFNGFRHNPVGYARDVRCPVLFLHGTEDPRAHIEEARNVFAAVRTPKKFKEFPGLGHEDPEVTHPAEWKEAVTQFLRSAGL